MWLTSATFSTGPSALAEVAAPAEVAARVSASISRRAADLAAV